MRFTVRAPASTANLGPGFDTFGLSLALHDVVEFETAESGVDIEVLDAGAGDMSRVPRTGRHLVLRALRSACHRLGTTPPGLRLRCHNAIPHSRGLGSSAAAIVTGVVAAYTLADRELDAEALHLAAEFEGHADNVAASLYGGFVVAWESGEWYRAERLTPHEAIRPVVAVPPTQSSTHQTRGLLPEQVPLADAVFTGGRTALAVHAMTSRPDLLLEATDDRLHQGYRRPAYPDTMRLVDELRSHGIAAAVSGAGPTVLALPFGERAGAGIIPPDVDVDGFDILEPAIDLDGAQVSLA
ncbi:MULTISPECIES: homoserine kinase [Prauserella salsuginis group]|uniref:Homoserine kinase n=1 Tax=Prauserella salsuginis TaxID=387889 RepID=A0ABW6G9G4_9PSEU|nr:MULTISPECIES: homoserine kinase [Prauserella salsuginis group]MCR3721570.1 homoserine kinase [Prauserella flava]MCR3734262.1 homoserine kinase [Prauserella salsuginis]